MFNLGTFFTRFKRGGKSVSYVDSKYRTPARHASGAPYEGAAMGRRLGSWTTTRDAINSVWYQSQDQLVARSRDLVRKDGWAAKAVDEWVCNAIGTGIKPQSLHPKEAIKQTIQTLWAQWVDEADAAGICSFYGLEALAFRSMVEGGECFVRKPNGHAAATPPIESPHGPVIAASSARTITASQGLTTLITELRLKREFIAKQLATEVESRTALTAKIDILERECGDCEREIGMLDATLNSLTGSRLGDAVAAAPVSAPAVDLVPPALAPDTIPCSPVADVMPPAPLPGQ